MVGVVRMFPTFRTSVCNAILDTYDLSRRHLSDRSLASVVLDDRGKNSTEVCIGGGREISTMFT